MLAASLPRFDIVWKYAQVQTSCKGDARCSGRPVRLVATMDAWMSAHGLNDSASQLAQASPNG